MGDKHHSKLTASLQGALATALALGLRQLPLSTRDKRNPEWNAVAFKVNSGIQTFGGL